MIPTIALYTLSLTATHRPVPRVERIERVSSAHERFTVRNPLRRAVDVVFTCGSAMSDLVVTLQKDAVTVVDIVSDDGSDLNCFMY